MSKIIQLSSKSNEKVKLWRSLNDSRGIKKSGYFLLCGRKTVPETLTKNPGLLNPLLFYDEAHLSELPQLPNDLALYQIDKELFKELDSFGTNFPLLIGQCPKLKEIDLSEKPKGLEIFCAMGDPANLGAVIRSAVAMDVSKIVLLEQAANAFHPKTLRASSATSLFAPLYLGPSLQQLKGDFFALDMKGENIFNFSWPKNIRMIIGEEGPGIGQFNCKKLSIPMNQNVESLNVAAASAIAFALYRRQSPNGQI